MGRINILSPFVADLIAAGEVVERPASVIKELVENSIDAGAKNITVEIRGGGGTYIRVTDDGSGMSAEDASVAFFRHATSKLEDENGLAAIGTLGFRGEALAAIGSVSQVELLTCEQGAALGTRLLLHGGEITELREAGCPGGTTIIIRGLFFNTPARLKFLKSDRAEASACQKAALAAALGHPEVSLRFIKDGVEEFFSPGDSKAQSAIYALLGRDFAAGLLPAVSDDGQISVTGFVSSPAFGRGNRGGQFFFCNGRSIRSQLLTAAVEQAYKNTQLKGRYPSCVIYLHMPNAAVDVNVHPAKTEVRFSNEKPVFDAVYYAAAGALSEKPAPTELFADAPTLSPRPADPPSVPWAPERRPTDADRIFADRKGTAQPDQGRHSDFKMRELPLKSPSEHYQTALSLDSPPSFPPSRSPAAVFPPALHSENAKDSEQAADDSPAENSPVISTPAEEPIPLRIIGEAFDLYCLVEYGDELIIIDKHAAHERIIFDSLEKKKGSVMSQTLIEAVPLTVEPETYDAIEAELPLLAELGFELSPFGENTFILRTAPFGLDPSEAEETLAELVDGVCGPHTAAAQLRSEALKTVACKAAIKAGERSDPAELHALAVRVCSGEVRFCPHGRPVAQKFARRDLEKLFKRIV